MKNIWDDVSKNAHQFKTHNLYLGTWESEVLYQFPDFISKSCSVFLSDSSSGSCITELFPCLEIALWNSAFCLNSFSPMPDAT